jgi:hypothetical protein
MSGRKHSNVFLLEGGRRRDAVDQTLRRVQDETVSDAGPFSVVGLGIVLGPKNTTRTVSATLKMRAFQSPFQPLVFVSMLVMKLFFAL